jgi:mRNA interferase MazF
MMQRGELYWASLTPCSGSEQQGRRPVIIVSNDGFNQVPTWRSIIVIPVTSSPRQARRGPTVVPLPSTISGLTEHCCAICHQITTLDRRKLEQRIGLLTAELMTKIEVGIAAACDLHL